MSENDTDKTLTTETTSTSTTEAKTSTSSDTLADTSTSTGKASTSEFVDDPVEKKETFTLTNEEQVMSDAQYLNSSIDEMLNLISGNSLLAKHSVTENFTSTTRTPSDEPRIVTNILDAIALALEKLEAKELKLKEIEQKDSFFYISTS